MSARANSEIVNLHIDSLILEGIPERDRMNVAEAVRAELGRLLSEGGVPDGLLGGRIIPMLAGGTYSASPKSTPEATGASIAQAIHAGMK